MDTFQLIALIVVALVILAVIIAFRKRIALTLKGWGFDLGLEAENEPRSGGKIDAEAQAEAKRSAGVRARGLRSEKGGIYIEEGRGHGPGGVGVEAADLDAGDDIIIGRGEGGDPKAPPPA